MPRQSRWWSVCLFGWGLGGIGLLGVCGCGGAAAHDAPRPATAVSVKVVTPEARELADFVEFTGRTEAREFVEIRARVNGYLTEIPFRPGKEVQKDDVLFVIDPRPYQAELDRSEATKATVEARLKRTVAELARATELREKGVNTQADFDKAVADQAEAAASLLGATASVEKAKLDLTFTKVRAPIDGLTSRELLTIGNLVAADSSLLTTIVSLDPVHAYFDVDERTALEIQARIRANAQPDARKRDDVPVRLGLQTETGFPHVGVIDLVNNRVDPNTGTLSVRARFENAERILMPGLFVRLQFQLGPPKSRLLIPERAIAQQQGQRYVYVMGADDKAVRKEITIGRLDGASRVVEQGLTADDRVVVTGLHRVRPGAKLVLATDAPAGETQPAGH
jgi:RND family efflux transporter MFP subunit